MEDLVVPDGGFVISNEDTQEIEPYKPPIKKSKEDPEIEIKFYLDQAGGRVAVHKSHGIKDFRIVPANLKLSSVYPTKIKRSVWNNFVEWKKK